MLRFTAKVTVVSSEILSGELECVRVISLCVGVFLNRKALTALARLRMSATPKTLFTTWIGNGSADGRLRSSLHKETGKVGVWSFYMSCIAVVLLLLL